MSTIAAALLLSGMAPETADAAQSAAAARQRMIAACRIDHDRLVIEHDGDPSFYSIALKGSAPLSAARLGCFADHLADGQGDFVGFTIEDEHLARAYDRMRRHRMVTSARTMLRRLGLLGRLPTFHRHRETLRSFAGRLERLCGATPHSVLRVADGRISIRDDTPSHPTARQARRWLCVTDAAILTGHDPITVQPPPIVPVDLPDVPLTDKIEP